MLSSSLTAVTLLSLAWAAPAPTQVKDPAALLPATTLAYGELRQPGPFVKEIASLFEGSALGNVPDSLVRLLEVGKGRPSQRGFGEVGAFGLLFSPEMVKEAQRVQGAAVALTGFKAGQPEWVLVVLPGTSNAPAFVLRGLLSAGPAVPAGEVEGVRLYRLEMGGGGQTGRGGPTRPPGSTGPPQRQRFAQPPPGRKAVHSLAPVAAMMPGVLFIGSPDAVKDAIRRAKGKGTDPTLASVKMFRQAGKEIGSYPGLFAYFQPARTLSVLKKELGGKVPGFRLGMAELAVLGTLKAFPAVAYGMTLEKGTLRASKLAFLDPKEKSPFLTLLPSKPVSTALFHFTPKDAVFAVALSNDNAKERWTQILKMVDALARLGGKNAPVPSEQVAGFEKALGIDFGKDVLGKITAVSFALGNPLDAPVKRIERKGPGFRHVSLSPEIPVVFVLQTASAEDAKSLIALLPRVFGLAHGGKKVEPASKEIAGRKILILSAGMREVLCYGRQGSTIVIGPFARPVAQALGNGAGKKGWLSDARVAARLKKSEPSILLGVARPFTLLAGGLFMGASESRRFERVKPPRDIKPQPPRNIKPPPPARQAPVRANDNGERVKKDLAKLLKQEGLLLVRVTRQKDSILAEATLSGLKPVVGHLTDFMLKHLVSARGSVGSGRVPEESRPRTTPDSPPRQR